MSALKQIKEDVTRLWSLIVGLNITGRQFVKPQITVHYPRQVVDNISTFRGPLELVPRPNEPGKPKCIACMMCVSACPSNCLKVVMKKPPKPTPEELEAQKEAEARGEKIKKPPKEPASFIYDYTLCSLCGSCVDACPAKSLRFSTNEAYLAGPDRTAYVYDLLDKLARQGDQKERMFVKVS